MYGPLCYSSQGARLLRIRRIDPVVAKLVGGQHFEHLRENHTMEFGPKELVAIAIALAVTVGVIYALGLSRRK